MIKQEPLILKLDRWEATIVDFVVKAVVWLTPTFTAILLYQALRNALTLDVAPAIIGAAVIELAGLAFMHSMMAYFYEWKGEQPAKVNFFITLACVIGYTVTALVIALVVKFPNDVMLTKSVSLSDAGKIIVPALAVILSMQSALVGAVRASTMKARLLHREQQPGQKESKSGQIRANAMSSSTARRSSEQNREKPAGSAKRPDEQSADERRAHLDRANEQRELTITERRAAVEELLNDGRTQQEIAETLGVHPTTVYRDKKALEEKQSTGSGLIDALPMDDTGKDALKESVDYFTNGAGGGK